MKTRVTVIPLDRLIIVDDEGLFFDFSADPSVHAIQWYNNKGHIEYINNTPNSVADYVTDVLPYVLMWEEEKERLSTPYIPTLEEAKQSKMTDINNSASNKIMAGFWYQDSSIMSTPLHFSFNTEDQSNFNSAMNGANLYLLSSASGQVVPVPDSIMWNGYTDIEHRNLVRINFNADTFIQFWGYAETVHKNTILAEAATYKEQVTNATTLEELQDINWN